MYFKNYYLHFNKNCFNVLIIIHDFKWTLIAFELNICSCF